MRLPSMKEPSQKGQSTKGPTHEEAIPKEPYRRGMSLRSPLVLYINSDLYQSRQFNHSIHFTINTLSARSSLSAREENRRDELILWSSSRRTCGHRNPSQEQREASRMATICITMAMQGDSKNVSPDARSNCYGIRPTTSLHVDGNEDDRSHDTKRRIGSLKS